MDTDILDLRFAFLVPVMGAGEEADDEDDDEDEDEEGSDDGADADAVVSAKLKAANDEAKKHRLRAKQLAQQLREKEKTEQERADKEKPELERLKTEVARLKPLADENTELKIRVAVLEKANEYKISDVDYMEFKLRKQGLLKLDEEGDLPDTFEDAVKKLAGEMSKSETDEDSRNGARSDDAERPTPPTSPRLGGKKKQGSGKESDLAALARRYPALSQKSGTLS